MEEESLMREDVHDIDLAIFLEDMGLVPSSSTSHSSHSIDPRAKLHSLRNSKSEFCIPMKSDNQEQSSGNEKDKYHHRHGDEKNGDEEEKAEVVWEVCVDKKNGMRVFYKNNLGETTWGPLK